MIWQNCSSGLMVYAGKNILLLVLIMDELFHMIFYYFHLPCSLRIGVWNSADDSGKPVLFFNNIKTFSKIDIIEISDVRYPVIHLRNTVFREETAVF